MKEMKFKTGQNFSRKLDKEDKLFALRAQFQIPSDTIYMNGNSLGLMPYKAKAEVEQGLREWGSLGINGWLGAPSPWFYLAEAVGGQMADFVGANPEEVIATGSTTVNLHALLATFYQPAKGRCKILADELNFPSDIYAIKGFLKMKGRNPEKDLLLIKSTDGLILNEEDIIGQMNEEVALIILPSVLYRSGQLLNLKRLTEKAHEKGILIGFDCSHSAGAVPHNLHQHQIDFAFWCSYKYLNGGPGSPGFMFIHENHFQKEPLMAGWFGCKKTKQFNMNLDFEPAQNAGGWQISTPNILGLYSLKGSLDVIRKAGMREIREKSQMLTSYFIFLMQELSVEPYCFRVDSPLDPDKRSGHVAISHPEYGWQICQALRDLGVIPDFRPPNMIRVAPMALYNTFSEVFRVKALLKEIIDKRLYTKYDAVISTVS